MLSITHAGHTVELRPDSLVVIHNATIELYEELASEDLKLDFDGERLFIHSPATVEHEDIVFEILRQLKAYFKKNPERGQAFGSHVALRYPNGKRSDPDIMVVYPREVTLKTSMYEGIPLIVVEVLSPSTREYDLTKKKSWAVENAVPEIWLVDPEEKAIIVYFRDPKGQYSERKINSGNLQTTQFPGLSVDIPSIFPK